MILRRGSSGDNVRRLQTKLSDLGLYRGPIDGSYGGGTEAAVKSYQKQKALSPNGSVSRETWVSLFPAEPPPVSKLLAEPVSYRCLALTGSFETTSAPPECFCGITGDFDGQGISFGALQWNFGQGSLQPLLKRMITTQRGVCEGVFHEYLPVLEAVLASSREEQFAFCRSVQDTRHAVVEPWRGMFKALGRTPEFQAIQTEEIRGVHARAQKLAADYGLSSERAVALMFDIIVQNGSISEVVKAQIHADFAQLPPALKPAERELARMRIVAQRRASAARPQFVADVLSRKMTIAEGSGMVHGLFYDLEDQFGLRLETTAAATTA
jgi:hypothetical protein